MNNKNQTGKTPFFQRKATRITGFVLAGLAVLALVLPAIMGVVINSRVDELRASLEEQGLPVTDMRLERGWFTSGLEVDLEPPALFAPAASGGDEAAWTVYLGVHHGPVVRRYNSPALGVARLAGTLSLPPDGFADGRAPVELQIHIFADFGNEQQASLIVPSRFEELETADQDITVEWAGLRMDTHLVNGQPAEGNLLMPGIEVRIRDKADEDFLLAGLEGVRITRGNSMPAVEDDDGSILPGTRIEAGEIYYDLVVQGNRRAMSMDDLLVLAENTPDDGREGIFHQRGRTSLGAFHLIRDMARVPASDIVLRHRIENLDRQTLAAFSKLFSAARLVPGLTPEAAADNIVPDLLNRLTENGTAFSILSLEGETPVGGFSGWMDLTVNERAGGDASGLLALANALTGEGEVILEERLARAMARFSLRRQLGEVTDTLAPEALDTLADALLAEQAGTYGLRRADGQYELQFEVTGGYLFVGGQPVFALASLLN